MNSLLIIVDNLGNGGTQKQIFLLTRELYKKGIVCNILTYHQYTEDFYQEDLIRLGIEVTKIHEPNYLSRFIKVRRLIIKKQPEVVLSMLYGANMLVCLIKASTSISFRLVVSDRSGIVGSLTAKDKLRLQLYKLADGLIVNNNDYAKKTNRFRPMDSKENPCGLEYGG